MLYLGMLEKNILAGFETIHKNVFLSYVTLPNTTLSALLFLSSSLSAVTHDLEEGRGRGPVLFHFTSL